MFDDRLAEELGWVQLDLDEISQNVWSFIELRRDDPADIHSGLFRCDSYARVPNSEH